MTPRQAARGISRPGLERVGCGGNKPFGPLRMKLIAVMARNTPNNDVPYMGADRHLPARRPPT